MYLVIQNKQQESKSVPDKIIGKFETMKEAVKACFDICNCGDKTDTIEEFSKHDKCFGSTNLTIYDTYFSIDVLIDYKIYQSLEEHFVKKDTYSTNKDLVQAAKDYFNIDPSQYKVPHETYNRLLSVVAKVELEEEKIRENKIKWTKKDLNGILIEFEELI